MAKINLQPTLNKYTQNMNHLKVHNVCGFFFLTNSHNFQLAHIRTLLFIPCTVMKGNSQFKAVIMYSDEKNIPSFNYKNEALFTS